MLEADAMYIVIKRSKEWRRKSGNHSQPPYLRWHEPFEVNILLYYPCQARFDQITASFLFECPLG